MFPRNLVLPLIAFVFAGSFLSAGAAEEPKPDVAKLRAALTKSLGYLGVEGDRWMEKKDCNGCHHMPLLLWSQREALRRGLPVDEGKFEAGRIWAEARAADKKAGLEELAYMILATPAKSAPELVKTIAGDQQPNGSWKPAGQFASMQSRGAADAEAKSNRLFLLALGTGEDSREAANAARTKASALLAKKEPAKSVDTLVFRLLYAQSLEVQAEVDSLRQEILKLQRGDGGWSWSIGENQSDPLATGEVLYALGTFTDPASAQASARAQNWLLATQQADGSWATDITHISKVDRSGAAKAKSMKDATEIYHYWGSAWATIGLMQAVPVSP